MSEIFISYKKEDVERVRPMVQALTQAGYDVWWDHRIPPGRTYRDVIGAALASAKCVIVVWSRLSATAQWVLDEADEGKRRNVLLPLMIDEVDPPYGFRQIEAARLIGWAGDTTDPEWQGALAAVAHFVGREAGGAPAARAAPVASAASLTPPPSRPAAVPAPAPAPLPHLTPQGTTVPAGASKRGLAVAGLLGAAVLVAGLSGAFGTGPDPAEPAEPATAEAEAPAVAAALGCYWQDSNDSTQWVLMEQFATVEQCFAQDSCDGGLGQSGGGCYKWAQGPDAPALRWPKP